MNDNYENIFGCTFQTPDLVISLLDQEVQSATIPYLNDQTLSVPSPSDQLLHNNATHHIPFVEIHTNNIRPQINSFTNVFRRSNQEIKSEPIKSESTDNAGKDRTNRTPTPARSNNSCSGSDRVVTPNENIQSASNLNANSNYLLGEACPPELLNNIAFPIVRKCTDCPFMCLDLASFNIHISIHNGNAHARNCARSVIHCPGCENKFYAEKSFKVHLHEDHYMSITDCEQLINVMRQTANERGGTQNINILDNNITESIQEAPKKNRIYLKDVECLREPRREVTEPINQVSENLLQSLGDCDPMLNVFNASDDIFGIFNTNEMTKNGNKCSNTVDTAIPRARPKQKIYIKSVDVLREPQVNFHSNNRTNMTALDYNERDLIIENGVTFSPTNGYNKIDQNIDKFGTTNVHKQNTEKHISNSKPKIYIKNDILKGHRGITNIHENSNPNGFIFLPSNCGQNDTDNYLNNLENLSISVPTLIEDCDQLESECQITEKYTFDNTNLITNVNDNNNYNYLTTSNDNDYLICDHVYPSVSSRLETPENYSNESSSPLPVQSVLTTPSIIENMFHNSLPSSVPMPEVPTAVLDIPVQLANPQQKQKISIKNVDILKAPQFQEHRGTLHLRTVDELNLMNKNEVENLIAPHLDVQVCAQVNENGIMSGIINPAIITSASDYSTTYNRENIKVHELAPHTDNTWADDYDLGDDIDCIITSIDPINLNENISLGKNITDLDTQQMSAITIRDIEELTDTAQQNIDKNDMQIAEVSNQNDRMLGNIIESNSSSNIGANTNFNTLSKNIQAIQTNVKTGKQLSNDVNPLKAPIEVLSATATSPPPLVPVSLNTICTCASSGTQTNCLTNSIAKSSHSTTQTSTLPVPPLVPVSSRYHQYPKSIASFNTTGNSTSNITAEKARIYVAHNLLKTVDKLEKNSNVTEKAKIGRRKVDANCNVLGSATKVITKSKMLAKNEVKCNANGCSYGFKKRETLEYHKRCHIDGLSNVSNSHHMQCPECKSTSFSSWNTLHTHLWRVHEVDMELYSCDRCTFKTPVFSRLFNTHLKIHSEDRNYKCDTCDKAFKNAKQLKNHRRLHRINSTFAADTGCSEIPCKTSDVYRCEDCGAVFAHQKTLKDHICRNKNMLKCTVCERKFTSKNSLRMHMYSHEVDKRFKCNLCKYTTNDHNAFRRHKMVHDVDKQYSCPFCGLQFIQSVTYQIHLQKKHPNESEKIVHKCQLCAFATINPVLFKIHKAKHESESRVNSHHAAMIPT
ncbi:uncharacterized protein LOC119667986 [Teleopsis dalmanni]|uniref:uncharacterized protein LOC119667986 n=1 Tax=Teleopsis dalmanni TaxID=139649 RepID=UPI0018CDD513|nr:uncharacterized protein LOC119667986 [Teleopsis dalmanni]